MIQVADKVLLFFYTIAILILTTFGIAVAAGAVDLRVIDPESATVAAYIIGAFLLLASLRLLYLALKRSKGGAPSIDQRNEYGDIRISIETVENLALKAASRIRGIRDLRSRVRVTDAGLEISIRSVVDGETSIPALTEEVQSSVKQLVEEITGIPVAFVSVYVANISHTSTFKSRVE